MIHHAPSDESPIRNALRSVSSFLIRDALRLESQGRYHVQIVVRNLMLFAVGGSCSEKPNN
jgi:hypothetical protein